MSFCFFFPVNDSANYKQFNCKRNKHIPNLLGLKTESLVLNLLKRYFDHLHTYTF